MFSNYRPKIEIETVKSIIYKLAA